MPGLIDRLAKKRALHYDDGVTPATDLHIEDLRRYLRSDETREALDTAIDAALGSAILGRQAPKPLVIDAVIRVITGEATEMKPCPSCGKTYGPWWPNCDRPKSSNPMQSGCPQCGWCY